MPKIKIGVWFIIGLFSFSLIAGIFLSDTAWAATGRWIDRQAIEFGGNRYIDSSVNSSFVYVWEDPGEGNCINVIYFRDSTTPEATNNNSAVGILRDNPYDSTNQVCQYPTLTRAEAESSTHEEIATKYPSVNFIDLSDTSRSKILFYHYLDDDFLLRADGKETYDEAGNNNDGEPIYHLRGENSCPDRVAIKDNSGGIRPGVWTMREVNSSGSGQPCNQLNAIEVNINRNLDLRPDLVQLAEQGGNTAPGGSGDSSATECVGGGALGWILCPAAEFLANVADWVQNNVIKPFLTISPLETGTDAFNVWKAIRNLANVLLIPVFFVIIFSQALSLNVDAYTIKKILPKLIAATILIQFSYYIAAILVDITNVLGNGLGNLILAPLSGSNINLEFGSGPGVTGILPSLAGIITRVAAIALAIIFLIPLTLVILAVFFTLVFRQIIVISLAIIGPIAFAAWVLPNTEKFFKLWWDNLLKALMMYPLIVLLFAAAEIVAAISSNITGSASTLTPDPSTIGDIVALAVIAAPLAMIPFTFRFAGAGLGAIAGGIQKGRGWLWGGGEKRAGKLGSRWTGGLKKGYSNVKAGRPGVKIPFSGGRELRAGPDSKLGKAASFAAQPWRLRQSSRDAALLKGMGAGVEEASKQIKTDFAESLPVAQMIMGGRQAFDRMQARTTAARAEAIRTGDANGVAAAEAESRNNEAMWSYAKQHVSSLPHALAAKDIIGQSKQVDKKAYEDLRGKFGGHPLGAKAWSDMQLASIDKNPHLFRNVDYATGLIAKGGAAKALETAGVDKAKDFSLDAFAHALRDKYEIDHGGNQTLSDATINAWAHDPKVSEAAKQLVRDAQAHFSKGGSVEDMFNDKSYRNQLGLKELFEYS